MSQLHSDVLLKNQVLASRHLEDKQVQKILLDPEGTHLLTYSYYVITVSPICAFNIHHSRIKLQPLWLQHATAVLVKVQCQV